jgi:flagellar hook-associated protein FlgK
LENAIVTWHGNKFWVLSTLDKILPTIEEYHNALNIVQEDLKKDLGDRVFSINQTIEKPNNLPPEVIAELAVGIL